jgi:outer membrane protein insertion porin family
MTNSPVPANTTVETEGFETLQSDQLAHASGGYVWPGGNGGYGGYGGYGNYGGYGYAPQPQYYTVRSGDNLTNIAKANHESLGRLLRMNPQFQANPNLIYPGQQVLTGRTYPCHY